MPIRLTATQIRQRGDVVETANQRQSGGFEPVTADAGGAGLETDAIKSGAYGELMRRARQQALVFSFAWRGTDFRGTVESIGESMRLSLRSDLAAIPYSAENPAARGGLLAVVDTYDGGSEAKLTVVQGRMVMLEHEIPLPKSHGDTMANLITQLTMLVLNTAPYLDLIAEFTEAPARA